MPAGTDLAADVGQARVAGGVGISWTTIPDAWLGAYTPWVPALILLAGAFIWIGALVRNRRANRTDYFAPSEP